MAVPTVASYSLSTVILGCSLVITGTNFVATVSGNTVTIGGATVLTITAASTTTITCIVPWGATLGNAISTVVTNTNGTSSGGATITTVNQYGGLGQYDTAGEWLDNTGIYFGGSVNVRYTVGSGFSGWSSNNNGYVGLSWLQNVFVLTRAAWCKFLGNPAGGQVWPTGGGVAGNGQVNPN